MFSEPVSRSVMVATIAFFATFAMVDCSWAEMRIFELQHKPAGELADMVRELVGENAKVAAHRNTLVVNSSPQELNEVARLVESYDQALRMLRITVDQGKSASSASRRVGAAGRLGDKDVRVRAGRSSLPADSSIFVSSGDSSVALSGQASSYSENRKASQFLTVLEGSPASISIGRAVPFTSQLRYYSRQHPHFVESVDYQNVDTGFEVFPEVHGDMVRLEIRPYMNYLDRHNANHIVFHEMATTVNIPFGAWFHLGGQITDQNGLAREILGAGSNDGNIANSIRIRVDSNN